MFHSIDTNFVAKYMNRFNKNTVVKAKRGKGSYSRKNKKVQVND